MDHDVSGDKSSGLDLYLRPKRRRLDNDGLEISPYKETRTYIKRKCPILTMPTEVLQNIFRKISGEELAKTIRLVNKRFKILAEDSLNSEFLLLKNKLQISKELVALSLETSSRSFDVVYYSKLLYVIELMMFRYSLLKATIWRYVYFDMKKPTSCMYGGKIIDSIHEILNIILTSGNVDNADQLFQTVTQKNKNLGKLFKTFNIFFEKVTEMPKNVSPLVSGAKILDLLNCATNSTKNVKYEKLRKDMYTISVDYYFSYSWFVSFRLPSKNPKNLPDELRLMFMRVSRIVKAHSEMSLQCANFERQLSLRTDPLVIIKRPPKSVYTGYGEVGNSFFYYGVMNERAYIEKFGETQREQVAEEEYDDNDNANVLYSFPYLGTWFKIDLTCSVELAPQIFLETIDDLDNLDLGRNSKSDKRKSKVFDMRIKIVCPGAVYGRLPTTYKTRIHNQETTT